MKKILLNLIGLVFSLFSAFSQPGDIDVSFNTTDIGFGNGDGANSTVYCSEIQNDGKVVLGGYFTKYNGTFINRIARIDSNGRLDNTFNPGSGANSTVKAIAIQSNGKIIIGGSLTTFNGMSVNRLARLNDDGSLDQTFNFNLFTNGSIETIAIQNNGKIIIGGSFTYFINGITRKGIARLNEDGTFDQTFNLETNNYSPIYKVAIQNDGKIIFGGDFSFSFNGTVITRIARINSNGTLDNTFISGGANNDVLTLSIQNDGKIIVGGRFTKFNGIFTRYITRLNSNGTTDFNFSTGTTIDFGTGLNGGPIFSTSLQLDGKIIIGGAFDSYIDATGSSIAKKNITRFNANGTLDQTFDSGTGASSFVQTTCIQNDGKIIICGSFDKYNSTTYVRVARVNTNGSIDNSFNSGCGVNPDNGYIRDIAIQNDGKILIGGDFKKYNGVEIGGVARLNNDGSIDNTFDSGLGIDHIVHSLSLQNDGKIIIGGQFTTFNGIIRKNIARINTNGSLDTTFNPGSGNTSGIVYTTSIQSDGKIIIGGDFTSFNGTSINRLARLSSTGAIDNSFNSSMGLGVISNSFPGDYPIINSTVTQADGKLIIAGKFNTFNNNTWNDTSRRHIARLNNTGSLDLTFNPGGGFNNPVSSNSIPVLNVTMQNDGKIIAVGTFTKYNGISRNRIVRINTNGSIDNSFDPGLGANDTIHAVAIQSDGKIIIAGNFTSYNGLPANQIARLNQDGSLDTIFKSGLGANQDILSTGIQNDGKIIIGGQFTAYNNMGRNRIARLFGGSAPIFPEPAGIITGSQNVCQGQNSVIYSVPPIANASSYLWTLPNGVTGTSNTNSITVNYGNSAISGNITVKGINTSGEGTPATLAITVTLLPSNPGMIDGAISVCQGQNSINYSVPTIANATSYLWTLSNGMTGVSSTNSILIDFNSTSISGEITVKGLNSCGFGNISSLSITVNPTVGSASNIMGLTNVCQGQSSITYTVDSISNATTYNWVLPNGSTGTSTTNEITLDFGLTSTTDSIIVSGSNSCGNGDTSLLTINVNPLPISAGNISGSQNVCQGQNSYTYSVGVILNADSYLWTLPSGAIGSSSTNSINVDYTNSSFSGELIVNGVNSCGNGPLSFLTINVNSIPEGAGIINGLTLVCQGQNSVNYAVPSISDATSYIWSLPSGATGSSSTNSILIDFGMSSFSGNIVVYGTSICGDGSPSNLTVSVNPPPTINTQPTNAQVNIGNTAIFSLNANSSTYQWQINNGLGFQNITNGGQFSGATTNTFTVSNTTMSNNNNQFRCMVSNNNCSTLSNEVVLTIINNAGLEESNENNYLISPNPTNDFFYIKSNQNQVGNTFEIVDNFGRIVLQGKITSDNMLFDANKLSSGIYNIKVQGEKTTTVKLVKN